MTNSKDLFNDLVERITLHEDASEIKSIIYLLLERKAGLSQTDIIAGKEIPDIDKTFLDQSIQQVNNHTPIQYILGEAGFFGRTFHVNPAVLIPRPETELLVHGIKKELSQSLLPWILDIGTGSGCLAITLALEFPQAVVHATDISSEALQVARQNAAELQANVQFHQHDILHHPISFGSFDLIVSNPPYISEHEKSQMKKNVLDYEPHLALFAPIEDTLAFYKAIAYKSIAAIKPGGAVWVEINEHFGAEVATIFHRYGYHSVRIIKDLDNKDRIVTARYA